MPTPTVIVFDVNETLSDMDPLAQRFVDIGLPAPLAATWFAQVLRDGFALAAAGGAATFAAIGASVLHTLIARHAPNRAAEDAVAHVLASFMALEVHPDVPAGVRALAGGGRRLVTLSNGSTGVAESLLSRAGVRAEFELVLSVEAAGSWKPAPESYAYAARQCGVAPAEMMLVAVHPWDLDGAARAGLQTAWIDRAGDTPYPSYFTTPTHTVSGVDALARTVLG